MFTVAQGLIGYSTQVKRAAFSEIASNFNHVVKQMNLISSPKGNTHGREIVSMTTPDRAVVSVCL